MAKRTKGGRTSREDLRKAKEKRTGYLQFGAALVIAAVIGGVYISVRQGLRDLDPVTLCSEKPTSLTVLVVDVTDPMNLPQQQDFQNQLTKLKNSIPRYGKLSVIRVDATSSKLLRPVIERCNPGTSADATQWSGNPAKLQKQWSEGFDKPLSKAFEALAEATGANQSPIFESIQSVALTELQKPGNEDLPKRLIVASDLLQNTSAISFYKGLPTPQDFTKSEAFRRVRTDLRGVDIELWQLQRNDAGTTQPRALIDLWDRAIGEQRGSVARVYNVSG